MAARLFSPVIQKAAAQDKAGLDELAGEALAFFAAEPARLQRFFDTTGLSVATLRRAAAAPDFAVSLIDYLAADESLLVAFAAETGRDPAAISALQKALGAPVPTDD